MPLSDESLPDDEHRGFAFDSAGVIRLEGIAHRMVGETISRVHYVLLEYAVGPIGQHAGLRTVSDPAELKDPAWKFEGVHYIDFGIEFELEGGAKFFATWDQPWPDSLRFASGDMSDWTGTRWDVSDASPWNLLKSVPITSFDLNYEPWTSEGGFWCRDMTMTAGSIVIVIDGADADVDGQRIPSATNLAVTYSDSKADH